MSSATPQILIRDDGELVEVRAVLDELGVDWADGSKETSDLLPSRMLISSGPTAVEAVDQIHRGPAEQSILHLVVIDRASRSLRAMLERAGCDMVARRPVHPSVVRLLVQRALYPGDERRLVDRVAIGAPIKIKAGMLTRGAVLAELSRRGCGLITRQALDVGAGVKVLIPGQISQAGPLTLVGQVVGAKHNLTVEAGQHAAAVAFKRITRGEARALQAIMRSHAVGRTGQLDRPLGLGGEAGAVNPAPSSANSPPIELVSKGDRRTTPRGHFTESVVARAPGAMHSLLGRDLSIGGMCVAPDPALRVGASLQLAIFGQGGVRPVTVAAKVVRDGGEEGFGLRFARLEDKERARLQRIVDSLEEVGGSGVNTATVVSEVLENV